MATEVQQADFTTMRYVGPRFDGHSLPVEFLADVITYREILVETARWLFLNDKDRSRAPRGFMDNTSIHLQQLEPGSAIVKLALVSVGLVSQPNIYLERAETTLLHAIAFADEDQSPTERLPIDILRKFNKLGSGLSSDERIEFSSRTNLGSKPAVLTQENRKALVFKAGESTVEQQVTFRCLVPELDQEKRSCTLLLLDGSTVPVPSIPKGLYADIKVANFAYKEQHRILVEGTALYNRKGNLQSMTPTTVKTLDPLDVETRLEELSHLKAGWLDGKGKPLNKQGLSILAEALTAHYDLALPKLYIFPTQMGNVMLELNTPNWLVAMEWNLSGESHEIFARNKVSGKDEFLEVSAESSKLAVIALNNTIKKYINI